MEETETSKTPEIDDNKEAMTKAVLYLSETLNGKAEYYIGGGLAVFVLNESDFDRRFSDIDIMVPETRVNDTKIALEAGNYRFWDERSAHKNREDLVGFGGHHEYGAMDNTTNTRVGIYTFDTLPDGRIIFRQHFGEKDTSGTLVDKIHETILPPEIRKEDLFSTEPVPFKDGVIFTVTPEQIYLRKKNGQREKDVSDFHKIESRIDHDKIAKLEAALQKIETRVI